MKVTAKRIDRDLTLQLHGDLDVALPLRTTLDFSGVSFMDSSGIAVILRLYKRMQNLGGSMRVTHVQPQAMRVLRAASIGSVVTIEKEAEKL